MNIIVTGGKGFLGKHVVSKLIASGHDVFVPDHKRYDLIKESDVEKMFNDYIRVLPESYQIGLSNIECVIHLAAHGGGIGLNMRSPADLFYDNIMMGTLMMHYAREYCVKKYISIGTVCSYPRITPTPFKEDDIWAGYPHEINSYYGLAKKMALVQAQAYRKQYNFNAVYLIPVNMYGPFDSFDPDDSHVIPALIKKFYEAKKDNKEEVVCWGTGNVFREFLYVEDCADAIILAMEKYDSGEPVNIGTGKTISIYNLVKLIAKLMEYDGNIIWDVSKPDGQHLRQLDTSRAKEQFGFEAKTNLEDGLKKTIEWYKKERNAS
jgi:GDP-L-fucose synthase